jgi:hypothetical protein
LQRSSCYYHSDVITLSPRHHVTTTRRHDVTTGITLRFGSLVNGITNTARKAVTLALSFALFPERNVLTNQHVVGAGIFFLGLMVRTVSKDGGKKAALVDRGPWKHTAKDKDNDQERDQDMTMSWDQTKRRSASTSPSSSSSSSTSAGTTTNKRHEVHSYAMDIDAAASTVTGVSLLSSSTSSSSSVSRAGHAARWRDQYR